MEIKIESGVPIPERAGGGTGRFKSQIRVVMERMVVGDSIVIPRRIALSEIGSLVGKQTGGKFTYRKIDNNAARVWRIA